MLTAAGRGSLGHRGECAPASLPRPACAVTGVLGSGALLDLGTRAPAPRAPARAAAPSADVRADASAPAPCRWRRARHPTRPTARAARWPRRGTAARTGHSRQNALARRMSSSCSEKNRSTSADELSAQRACDPPAFVFDDCGVLEWRTSPCLPCFCAVRCVVSVVGSVCGESGKRKRPPGLPRRPWCGFLGVRYQEITWGRRGSWPCRRWSAP